MSNAPTAARTAFGDIAPAIESVDNVRVHRQYDARNGSQPSADWKKKVYGPDILNQQGKLYKKPACNM